MTPFAHAPVKLSVLFVAAIAIACALPAAASAAPGAIDHTFGHLGNGTVLADHALGDRVVKVLHQSDGKIVTVGDTIDGAHGTSIVVSRYLANGSLDATFGHGGVFTENVLHSGPVTGAVMQPDGKVVVVGSDYAPLDFFVQRLRTNGTVDPTFAPAHPTTNFGGSNATSDQAQAVVLAPGGKIVVAGASGHDVALARYTTTGALDPTFSGDGLATHNFGQWTVATQVAALPDGHLIVGGVEFTPEGTQTALLARFSADGNIDATFGNGGRIAPQATKTDTIDALLLQGTKIVIAGSVDSGTAALVRYNANGTLDPTFGSGGTTLTRVGKVTRITGLTSDTAGHLIASGLVAYTDDFPNLHPFTSVFRYEANGVRDQSFGCGGYALTEVLGNGAGKAYQGSSAATITTDGNDIVVGGSAETFNQTDNPPFDDLVARYQNTGLQREGYALLRGDGGTSAFGDAPACGSTAGLFLNAPIVGTAFDQLAAGYWTVASDGGIFSFGAARFLGSMGGSHLNQPIVGMAATPDGKGYWLVARDGGIFAFGTARFFGSTGAMHLNQPIVGMAATNDGKGYWLVARDGGIFAFGSAHFSGSTGGIHLNQPIVGMAADRDGRGYWLTASDGGVFAFDAKYFGSTGAMHLSQPVVGIAADLDGRGYWLAARDGGVFAFAASFAGSTGATPFPPGDLRSTVGIAAAPLVAIPG